MNDTHCPYFQQNLESNQRRRDLYQAMTANMESVFGFFLSLLEENYTQYKAHVGQQDSVTALCHCRVMQVWLRAHSCYWHREFRSRCETQVKGIQSRWELIIWETWAKWMVLMIKVYCMFCKRGGMNYAGCLFTRCSDFWRSLKSQLYIKVFILFYTI